MKRKLTEQHSEPIFLIYFHPAQTSMAAVPSFVIFFICLHLVIHGMTETTVLIIAKNGCKP